MLPSLARAVTALALVVSVPAADAAFHQAVGFSTDDTAQIVAYYGPSVSTSVDPGGTVDEVVEGVTTASCTWDAIGTSESGITGLFVGKVVTTGVNKSGSIDSSVPAATGVVCRLREFEGDDVIEEWTALRPGSAAFGAWTREMAGLHRPRICVAAYILYGNGRRTDKEELCQDL